MKPYEFKRFYHPKLGRFVFQHKGSGLIVDNIFKPLKCPSPQNIFFAKMNLCTCSKRIAAIFSFFQEILPFYRLRKLQKSKHLLFTTESEGEWVYS